MLSAREASEATDWPGYFATAQHDMLGLLFNGMP
jgi:hypothetical protein